MIECTRCGISKTPEGFYNNGTNGAHTFCKECKRKSALEYYRSNPDKVRDRNLMRKYGLTREAYDTMLSNQDNRCACCGTTEPGGQWGTFNVDHCHETGVTRELLCLGCNTGATIVDNPDLLIKKVIYLRKHGKMLSSEVMKDFLQ